MIENNEKILYIFKFLYKSGKNARQATNEIFEGDGADDVSCRLPQQRFGRFRFGCIDRERFTSLDEKVDEIIKKCRKSCHDITNELNIHIYSGQYGIKKMSSSLMKKTKRLFR